MTGRDPEIRYVGWWEAHRGLLVPLAAGAVTGFLVWNYPAIHALMELAAHWLVETLEARP